MARGEGGRHQPAVRHAAHAGTRDAGLIHGFSDLIDVAVEAARGVELPGTRWLVRQGEGDDAAAGGERLDGRLHPFPAPLNTRNEHQRRA
jgi:hypothetical protein